MDKMYQTIRAEKVLILFLMAAKDYYNTNGYNTDWFKMNKEQQLKKKKQIHTKHFQEKINKKQNNNTHVFLHETKSLTYE